MRSKKIENDCTYNALAASANLETQEQTDRRYARYCEQKAKLDAKNARRAKRAALRQIKPPYTPKRGTARHEKEFDVEAAAYTELINLGSEARKLRLDIGEHGENTVRAHIAENRNDYRQKTTRLFEKASGDQLIAFLTTIEEEGIRARDEFIEKCYHLTYWVVYKCMKAPMNAQQAQDAIGEAALVLFEVVKEGKYDREKASFAHYYRMRALPRLYKFINEDKPMKCDNDHIRVVLELENECVKFLQKHLREANYDEQAAMLPGIMVKLGKKPRKCGYDANDVAFYRGMKQVSYLNEPIGEDGDEVGDFYAASMRLEDEEAYQAAFEELRRIVNLYLDVLSDRDRRIVLERCLDEEYRETLEEIAAKTGLTKARIGQIFGGNPEQSSALIRIAKLCDLDVIRVLLANLRSCAALTY